MSSELPDWFIRAFAMPRLSPYLATAETTGIGADGLYLWNLQVAEAFYPSLHCLEISLRNALHAQLLASYSRRDWWVTAPLAEVAIRKIGVAREQAARQQAGRTGGPHPGPDDIVAELSFGFWASLLSRRYDRHLWVPVLHRPFPQYHGGREPLRDSLETMVLLRNRVMHHEPIHHRDLAADHSKVYRLIGYIEPEVIGWLRTFDRVPDLLSRRPVRRTA
jgi:hypothetical protein